MSKKIRIVAIISLLVFLLCILATPVLAAVPTVLTYNAEISGLVATLNGNITVTGNGTDDYRGFVWGYDSYGDPGDTAPGVTAYDYSWTESGAFTTGVFTHEATLETALYLYHVRACAHSDDGWAYGEELDFFVGEADKIYLEFRLDLDETRIRGNAGIPTGVRINEPGEGLTTGYSLPIWNEDNEELYFMHCVPNRWDGESHILLHITTALANANETGNSYQLQMEWEQTTPNVEEIPVTINTTTFTRTAASNTQFECYRDWFIVLYNADVGDDIIADDEISFRLRRIAAGGQLKELDGELIIIHWGILYARGDLLGNPDIVVTTTTFPGLIDDLIADETLLGGEDMVFLGILAIAAIMSFVAFRSAFFGLKLMAGMMWFVVFIFLLTAPPTGIEEGTGLQVALMLVSIGFGVMIVLTGLGKGVRRSQDQSGAFSASSEGFKFKIPDFLKNNDSPEARRTSIRERNDEYEDKLDRALHPKRRKR